MGKVIIRRWVAFESWHQPPSWTQIRDILARPRLEKLGRKTNGSSLCQAHLVSRPICMSFLIWGIKIFFFFFGYLCTVSLDAPLTVFDSALEMAL